MPTHKPANKTAKIMSTKTELSDDDTDNDVSDDSVSNDDETASNVSETSDLEEVDDNEQSDDDKHKVKNELPLYDGDETCLYDVGKHPNQIFGDDSDDEDNDNIFGEEIVTQQKRVVNPEDRITKPILTKYERVRILSERRKQLVLGAKPMIKIDKPISEKDIASFELKSKVIPLIIVRTLPNGNIEHWKIDELEIIN